MSLIGLRLRSALCLSSPIYQLRRQVSSLPLQNQPSPSSAAYPFPIPRDPSSPPLQLPTDLISKFDYTASHVWSKVKVLTDLFNLDAAAEYARLAVLAVPKSPNDTESETQISETCQRIIGKMCHAKRFEEAYELFHYFYNVKCLKPDYDSCCCVLNALSYQGRLDEAIIFYRSTIKYAHFNIEYGALMNALIDAGRIDEAFGLFFGGFTYYDFIQGYLAHGNIDKANKLLEDLKEQHERYPKCVDENKIAMLQVAYMEHCFKQGKEEEAMEWYHSALVKRYDKPAEIINAALRVLLKYGKKTEAWSLFDKLTEEDEDIETSWIMIEECFETGEISKAMEIARKKARAGNSGCYSTVLASLLRQGMVSEAEEIFNEMFSSGRIPLYYELWKYRMMVDGFVKAGRFDDAHRLVNKIAHVSLSYVSRKGLHSGGLAFVI